MNYNHIMNHTSQTWADTFINELNDTRVEAEERMRHVPPKVSLSVAEAVLTFRGSTLHAAHCVCVVHGQLRMCAMSLVQDFSSVTDFSFAGVHLLLRSWYAGEFFACKLIIL